MLKLIMKIFLRTRKFAKKYINILLKKKASIQLKSQNKWLAEAIISENLNINWKKNLFFSISVYKGNKAERVSV